MSGSQILFLYSYSKFLHAEFPNNTLGFSLELHLDNRYIYAKMLYILRTTNQVLHCNIQYLKCLISFTFITFNLARPINQNPIVWRMVKGKDSLFLKLKLITSRLLLSLLIVHIPQIRRGNANNTATQPPSCISTRKAPGISTTPQVILLFMDHHCSSNHRLPSKQRCL